MYKILSSYKTMLLLLSILAIGAGIGTFIENDFGSLRAKEIVYFSFWYSLVLFLTAVNILLIVYKNKMYRVKARMIFHISFVVILIGAALTHFMGIDGMMHIREGEQSNSISIDNEKIQTGFTENIKPMIYNSVLGLGIAYEISKKVSINLSPTFKYSLSPVNTGSGLKYHPYSLSWFTGISYKL